MAKIRKFAVKVYGDPIDLEIHYHARRRHFFTTLTPAMQEYADATEADALTADTEEALIEKIKDFVKKYEAAKLVERKVIRYLFQTSSKNFSYNDGWCGDQTTEYIRVKFDYKVVLERDVDGIKKYYEVSDNPFYNPKSEYAHHREKFSYSEEKFNSDWSEETIIEWSAEREAAFEKLYGEFERLIKRVREVTETPEKLLKNIQTMMALPAPAPSKKGKGAA